MQERQSTSCTWHKTDEILIVWGQLQKKFLNNVIVCCFVYSQLNASAYYGNKSEGIKKKSSLYRVFQEEY